MLTKKQRELLIFIHEKMKDSDVAPSFDEMRVALGLKSKSGIHRLISALVERGYLERLPHRARALQVKRLPKELEEQASQNTAPLSAAIAADAMMSLPMYGRIAAGTPIEAIRNENGAVDIPPNMMGAGEHYALEVDGESMIKAGINDGDTVIIKKCDTANDGDIVVALVDGEEVTLKRLARRSGQVILIPENDEFNEQVYAPEQVQIQGKLVSLMRTYH
ncbi:MAG: transcriptional repressor LexA [Alphaproteobacteria bacterium]|nr:transcriptional repressor LexA [Alphaproteobacteria bacterium]